MAGPNQPIQNPNIDLPGLEYASLTPGFNASVQGRRRVFGVSTPITSVPASSTALATATVTLSVQFVPGSAFYMWDIFATFGPGDGTQELQITGSQLRALINGQIGYQFGTPQATFLTPGIPQVVIRDQNKMVTTEDMVAFSGTGAPAFPTSISLQALVSVKNLDATNAHTFNVSLSAVWDELKGLVM